MKLKTIIIYCAVFSCISISCNSDQKSTIDQGTVVDINDESNEIDNIELDIKEDTFDVDESMDFQVDTISSDDSVIYYDDIEPEGNNE